MARTATGGHRGWLVAIASVWILAAGVGGAVLGAWIGDATCTDAEQGFGLECVSSVARGLFVGFAFGVLAGWLTTRLVWTRLPALRGPVLLIAAALVITGVVLTFTLTNESNPSPSPAFQFGPDDALP